MLHSSTVAERTLYPAPRATTPELGSRGPTPTRDATGGVVSRAGNGDHSRIQSTGSTILVHPTADEATAPQATISPFVVRAIQDNADCPQLQVPSRPVRYLLLREGCFALRLESALHEPLIAKLEVDGKMTKSNFRILPNSSHTIRETRGGTGMHAVPLAFAPSPEQRRPANNLEDVDLHTGLLRIFFYAVANTNDGKWEIASRQQPLEVVMLKYGFRDTLARFFNVPLGAGNPKSGKGAGGVVPPIPKDIAVYHSMTVPALALQGPPSRTSTPPLRAATPKLRPVSPRTAVNPMSELFAGARGGIETAEKIQEKIEVGAPPGIHRAVHLEPFVTKFDGSQPPPLAGQVRQAAARPAEGSQHSVCVNCDRLFAVERARMLAEIDRWKKKASDAQRQNNALHQKIALLNTQSRMLQEDLGRATLAAQRASVPSRSLKNQPQAASASGSLRGLENAMELLDAMSTSQHDDDGLGGIQHHEDPVQQQLFAESAEQPGPQPSADAQSRQAAAVVLEKAARWDASELHREYQIERQRFVSPHKTAPHVQEDPISKHPQLENALMLPPQSSRSSAVPSSVSQLSSRAQSKSKSEPGGHDAGSAAPSPREVMGEDDDILNMAMKIIAQERQQASNQHASTPQNRPQTVSTGSQAKPSERPLSATRRLVGLANEQDWEPPARALTPSSAASQQRNRAEEEGSPRQRSSPSPPVTHAVAYIDPFARRTRR